MAVERRRLRIAGTVQGVGFRPFVYRLATGLGLAGSVGNDARGVVVEAEGEPADLDRLRRRIDAEAPPLARVTAIVEERLPPRGVSGFRIARSGAHGATSAAVSVDVAVCDACLAEMRDPTDRRHRHPFISCTDCGPRYTIVRGIPYDRPLTTMAAFPMCERCRTEYENPLDRRFHAQPVCCPECGPHLRLLTPRGEPVASGDDAALDGAIAALAAGRVVAVKGLGGYHLACDAGDAAAVTLLRSRKARDDKPFAIMVADLDTARTLCTLDAAAEAALTSPARPIVLAPRRPGAGVADGVAPGLRDLGVMLAYTPLHHLLLDALRRPLVMTSGNRIDEPIAHEDDDAVARLGPMCDAILAHDRPIEVRCDDSVVRSQPGRVVAVRRSRGMAPEPMRLPVPAPRPLLAVGAQGKNTVAVARGDLLVVSHHVGDLDHAAAATAFLQAVGHLCMLYGISPEVVAHDLHPDYESTRAALRLGIPTVAVQHHHAHVAACLVEHGLTGPVVGVAMDGLGLGDDGTLWGGEVLVADLVASRRAAHLATVPLPGGDVAVREPWRMAVAWLCAAGGRDAAVAWGAPLDPRAAAVADVCASPAAARTSSAGRLLDAAAALLGVRRSVTYEGQAAIELEALARGARRPAPLPPFEAVAGPDGMAVIDPSAAMAMLAERAGHGTGRAALALAVHHRLAEAFSDAAVAVAGSEDLDTVVLTGGVMQNSLLAASLASRLRRAGLRVLDHTRVPPNDGGISAGQAAVAAARAALEPAGRPHSPNVHRRA